MILFFDVETTGKARFDLPISASEQPHIVQLAAILTDEEFYARGEINLIVRPEGYLIPDDVAEIHGITHDIAAKFGVHRETAVEALGELTERADTFVAHSFDFDCLVVNAFAHRSARGSKYDFGRISGAGFCTMKAMTPICKLPGNYGDYKWPKLQEAHRHAFGIEFDGAHDAMADVRACLRIYRWLKQQVAVVETQPKI